MSNGEGSYRRLSLWHDTVPDDLSPRAPLPGDLEVDIAIIGAGLTGLWTAYYLRALDPTIRIAVLEKHIAGYGASGRNGGWCSALFPASTAALERRHGRGAALAMRRAMIDTIDEIERVTAAEAIDCDFARGGTLSYARNRPQLRAAMAEVEEAAHYGVDRLSLLEHAAIAGVGGAIGGTLDPACARLHPAKLVRGLARRLDTADVAIYEQTEVLDWSPRTVLTDRGQVRARFIVVATEGYGATLKATRASVLPLYSLMIATEPLSDAVWDDIGIAHGQTFSDYRHLLVYGQRTADNRVAFGGRGAKYHLGSSIRPDYDSVPRVFEKLHRSLVELFPAAAEAAVTHRWGGPLGVPRDWHASVRFDSATGIGSAGGYVGDGLSTTNLAGRTLAHLITGADSALTRLPWVGHRSPDWEPEPLRFLGANLGLLAMDVADREERVTGRASVTARAMGRLTGH
jgi:glycine/D-amino acid oxidase-like deaminating enzyme